MKHKTFLTGTILSLLCLSCSTQRQVTVEYRDYRPVQVSSFVARQTNILLDTPSQETRIQDENISRLLFTENNIYVADRSGNKLLMFDRQGKFVRSVPCPTGNTPEHPARLTDATLDEKDGRIYVCCSGPDQMAVLDLDLNVERVVPLAGPLLETVMEDDYIYGTRRAQNGKGHELVVLHKDRMEEPPTVLLAYDDTTATEESQGRCVTACADGVYACLPADHRICLLRKGKIADVHEMDFGKAEGTERPTRLTNFCASEAFLLFNTDTQRQWFVVDRHTGKCLFDPRLKNDLCVLSSFRLIPTQGLPGGAAYSFPAPALASFQQKLKQNTGEAKAYAAGLKSYTSILPLIEQKVDRRGNPMIAILELK